MDHKRPRISFDTRSTGAGDIEIKRVFDRIPYRDDMDFAVRLEDTPSAPRIEFRPRLSEISLHAVTSTHHSEFARFVAEIIPGYILTSLLIVSSSIFAVR